MKAPARPAAASGRQVAVRVRRALKGRFRASGMWVRPARRAVRRPIDRRAAKGLVVRRDGLKAVVSVVRVVTMGNVRHAGSKAVVSAANGLRAVLMASAVKARRAGLKVLASAANVRPVVLKAQAIAPNAHPAV